MTSTMPGSTWHPLPLRPGGGGLQGRRFGSYTLDLVLVAQGAGSSIRRAPNGSLPVYLRIIGNRGASVDCELLRPRTDVGSVTHLADAASIGDQRACQGT